ncbi:MAG: TatD family hydrolase, partial [Bacteroidales bacterium]|nr:TatD family hydrolase [Bacteroidales bacterium]
VKGWDELRRARREVKPGRPWVIHGFRGSGSLAASLAEEGFWFSLGARGVTPEILESVSHERLLLETDETGQDIAEIYRLFAAAAGYEEPGAETLIRKNFNSLVNFTL